MSLKRKLIRTSAVFFIASSLLCASAQAYFKQYTEGVLQEVQVPQEWVERNKEVVGKIGAGAENGEVTLSDPKQIKELFESLLDCRIEIKGDTDSILIYEIQAFADKLNRNHWAVPEKQKVNQFVVTSGTVSSLFNTLSSFTRDIDHGRTSAQYVISCAEKMTFEGMGLTLNIPGGLLFKIGAEEYCMWYAGKSYWKGAENLNSCSIGVMVVNRTHDTEKGDRALYRFGENELKTYVSLIEHLKGTYKLEPEDCLYLFDVAGRHQAPWIQFPYQAMYEKGIGLGLDAAELGDLKARNPRTAIEGERFPEFYGLLGQIGYEYTTDMNDESLKNLTAAFQQHFTCNGDSKLLTGIPTQFDYAVAQALVKKYGTETQSANA